MMAVNELSMFNREHIHCALTWSRRTARSL